ncbi:unnamed protein product [Scytosiphon promiscuus]
MPNKDLAAAVRRCLNNMHGPEWHCVVGKVKAFSVNVRYWRGKSFLFEDGGLRIIVFQSAPPALGAVPPTAQALECEASATHVSASKAADRTGNTSSGTNVSIKVLRSEMEQGHQKRALAMASAAAKEVGKEGGDLDSIVATFKASLTQSKGPVWHVVATQGGGDWGWDLAHEEGQLLDFKLNKDRLLCWKHAQPPPGLADVITTKRISYFLFVTTVILLCVYTKYRGSCDRCCSSYPGVPEKAGCAMDGPSSSGGESTTSSTGTAADLVVACDAVATEAADLCLRNAKILFLATCGTLASATALKWTDRSKVKRHLNYQPLRNK